VVANVTAQEVTSGEEIKRLLIKQAASPVLWETSVRNMVANGVDIFVEVGPGKVLTGFTKKIAKGMTALNIEDPASLEKTLAFFEAK
jgi:[acyl-carrier-protein] S-malonyltransferase